jgi:hypothetical protein
MEFPSAEWALSRRITVRSADLTLQWEELTVVPQFPQLQSRVAVHPSQRMLTHSRCLINALFPYLLAAVAHRSSAQLERLSSHSHPRSPTGLFLGWDFSLCICQYHKYCKGRENCPRLDVNTNSPNWSWSLIILRLSWPCVSRKLGWQR